MDKGRFIVFEGIDGSGKTTQVDKLCERLIKNGIPADKTREPTDGEVGKLIRRALTGDIVLHEQTMSMLFAADRAEHIFGNGGILERINSGVNVVSDRYYFSSYAYNSVEVPFERIVELNRINREIMKPDCTVFIDLSVGEAMNRIESRIEQSSGRAELYETRERLLKVRENFFAAFEKLGDNVVIVDADADADTVAERVWEKVRGIFE